MQPEAEPMSKASAPSISIDGVSIRYPVNERGGNLLKRLSLTGGNQVPGSSKRREVLALDDVSLRINKGERIGLIGYNGSGKTTLLKSISGCLPPTVGRIEVRGRLTSFINIALGVDSNLTGAENLALRIQYWGLDKDQTAEFESHIIEFTGLDEFFYYPVKTYSAGMRARLLIGLSTLVHPDILVMDEWISTGDRAFLQKANERLEQFVSDSGILVFATHSRNLLLKWSTRLIWVDRGTIKADGDPQAVLAEYEAAK